MRRHIQHIFLYGCALAMLVAIPISAFADGFEGLKMKMGGVDITFSGNVNAFVTDIDCDADGAGIVAGGLACGSDGIDSDENNVQTGLLPSWLGFNASHTNDAGFLTSLTIGFQPGVDTNSALGGPLDGALGLNSSNFRQVFFEFGNKSKWGTFKLGRDLGLYGSDAILNDMTLLGVGTASDLAANGGNTTLGRIGVGYLYADWKAQLQYNSPNWGGFSFAAALVDPWGAGSIANIFAPGSSATAGTDGQDGDSFGIEAKVNYAFDTGGFGGKLWASYIQQDVEFQNAALAEDNPDAQGFDVGASLDIGPVNLVGYYYDGEGIGTTGFLLDGFDATGEERDSDGFYVQGTFKIPGWGTKLGLSFGESNLDDNAADAGTSLVETNESLIFGVYHPVNNALNLVVEYTMTEAESHNGNDAEEDLLAIGGILFF